MQLRKGILWVCWLFLLVIWLDTLSQLWRDGQGRPVLLAALVIPSLWLLYFAEGLELAVAARVGNPDSPVTDPHEFFTRRQTVVILTITFITLATVYPWLEVPWMGRLSGAMPFWFSLTFDSVSVLWFAQVVPKRLAVMNPDEFLQSRYTKTFLHVIRFAGLVFDGPSDDLVRMLRRGKKRSGCVSRSFEPCTCLICIPAIAQTWSSRYHGCTCGICRQT